MLDAAPVTLAPDARILVINVARIGDTLMITPILRSLKQALPRGELSCIAHPGRATALAHLPFLDHLIPMTKRWAPFKDRLGGKSWDYALVYGYDLALVRYALRTARQVVAFQQADAGTNARLFRAVPKPREPLHAVRERALLAETLGVTVQDARLGYQVTPKEKQAALAWRARHLAPNAAPFIVFHPTSFHTKPYRNWPLESFAELGRRIALRWPKVRFVITGGPDDRARADALSALLGQHAINYAGQGDLRQTAAILSLADLYIGVDTGLTHLAGALNLPMVALYHCLHPGWRLAPLQHAHLKLLEHPRALADCNEQTAMAEIDVNSVYAAAIELLDGVGK